MDNQKLEILLKEINLVSKEFKSVRRKSKFNIFTIIRNGSEEVGLHSKFIFELLSNNGSHGKKDLFLKLFLEQLNVKFTIEGTQVFCEKENIDILIKNKSQAIIIENKINAGDQTEQLSRYYNTVLAKGIEDIKILYLTLDGKAASHQSIEGLPKHVIAHNLIYKSYNHFILLWLSNCLKECATEPHIRETIVQYQNLLKQLTMDDDVKERKKLLELLGENNYMEQAQYLVNNWSHMRWHTEMNFWNDLFTKMPESLKKYEIIEEFLFSDKTVTNTVHKKRNKDFEYGISFKLFDYNKDEEICFIVERGEDYVDYGLFVNYINSDKNKWLIKKSDFPDFLKKNVAGNFIEEDKFHWIHWKYSKQEINFESFNDPTTLSLANPEKRKDVVEKLWIEMELYIRNVLKWDGIKS